MSPAVSDEPNIPDLYPCRFPIKVLGHHAEDFTALVVGIVADFISEIPPDAVTTRASSGGKYLAVTVTIEAQSREQLDEVYRALSGHSRVLMAL